jgi:hypothetical protein
MNIDGVSLEPISFRIENGVDVNFQTTIDLVRDRDGNIKYAVRESGACLCHEGFWEYEPQPSSRTDEWKARFRFATLRDAVSAWKLSESKDQE